jgi:hypothetical protein
MEEEQLFEFQQHSNIKRDKVDEVFDLEIIDEFQKPTSGEEIDADFSETVKCFSFNMTGEAKI